MAISTNDLKPASDMSSIVVRNNDMWRAIYDALFIVWHSLIQLDRVSDYAKIAINIHSSLAIIKLNIMPNTNEINMLRTELELLMRERQSLLKVTGAAAGLIAEMDSHDLPLTTVEAADLLATTINSLSEETLQDALGAVNAEIVD